MTRRLQHQRRLRRRRSAALGPGTARVELAPGGRLGGIGRLAWNGEQPRRRAVEPRDGLQQRPGVGMPRRREQRDRSGRPPRRGRHKARRGGWHRLATTAMLCVISRMAVPDVCVQVAHQLHDLVLHGHVERGGGLVGDHQRRPVGDRHGGHRALAHAAGEFVRDRRGRGRARCRPGRARRRPVTPSRAARPAMHGDRLGDLVADRDAPDRTRSSGPGRSSTRRRRALRAAGAPSWRQRPRRPGVTCPLMTALAGSSRSAARAVIDLPEPDLADQADDLARHHVEANALHDRDAACARKRWGEADRQGADGQDAAGFGLRRPASHVRAADRPSPSRFRPSTVIASAMPGSVVSHRPAAGRAGPVAAAVPSSDAPGSPRPRKLRNDSDTMAEAICKRRADQHVGDDVGQRGCAKGCAATRRRPSGRQR